MAKIQRFREKKKNRKNHARNVIYQCRKAFADRRQRVGGRFVADASKKKEADAKDAASAQSILMLSSSSPLPSALPQKRQGRGKKKKI
jgi:hypothetical protein